VQKKKELSKEEKRRSLGRKLKNEQNADNQGGRGESTKREHKKPKSGGEEAGPVQNREKSDGVRARKKKKKRNKAKHGGKVGLGRE